VKEFIKLIFDLIKRGKLVIYIGHILVALCNDVTSSLFLFTCVQKIIKMISKKAKNIYIW